jgi:PKD repeat protein
MNTDTNTSGAKTGILSLIAALILLAVIVFPASALQLNGQDVSATAIGETVEYALTLDEAPAGLAGYIMTVQLADPAVGEITAVQFPSWASLKNTSALPADSVTLKGGDLYNDVSAGTTPVTLVTLTLRADGAGTTPVTIILKQMDDDAGDLMSPTIVEGSFTVAGTTTPAPVADFSADKTSGDAPLAVRFTDLSTGDGISAWAWDFNNDGVVDSTEQNPAYTYTNTGTYSVKLVVTGTGGNGETTRTDFITVNDVVVTPPPTTTQVPPPAGNFAATPLTGDAPLNVQFTDQSTGDITSWLWDVNDDGTVECTTKDCSYTYTDPGSYTVKLTVSNDGGSDSIIKPDYINVTRATTPVPVAGFSGTPTSGVAPLSVQFTDVSSGTITDYAWDFNNDGVIDSTEQNPGYTYATAGTFTVTLTVTGPDGSDDETMADYITVSPAPTPTIPPVPEAKFSGTPTSGYAPLTVQFNDESTGDISAIYWDFTGDLQPDSTEHGPQYTFYDPGNYTVYMAVTGPGGMDYEVKTDYITVMEEPVPAPVAGFSATPTAGDAPLSVQFTDESTGNITSYAWDFENDGTIDSTGQSPAFVYSTAGTYSVSLTVTGKGGSDDETKISYITVAEPLAKPVANFTADPVQGIAPLSVQFTDASTGYAITAYAWDFENDGTIDSTEQNPQHSYATPGMYSVSLTATNAAGSDTKTQTSFITVTEPAPVAQFSGEPLSGAVPLTVNFTGASTNAASFAWDFENDGTIDSTEQNPAHTYTAAGNYTVNLTVANSAASASEVKADYITVNPAAPVANFSANITSGSVPLAVLFTDESTGDSITAWAWDFENDGVIDSSEQNPEHVYSLPGIYNVSMTVTSAGGSNTAIKEQYISATIIAPVADFIANQTSGYAPLLVGFTDNSTGTIESYAWDFQNDGTVDSSEQNPVYTYTAAGNYTVNLTVANAGGSNSLIKTGYINVSTVPAPVVDFSANLTTGYAPLSVQFTDDSKGIGLINWSWDFNNDGTVDSTEQNPVYTYANPGNYSVGLTVKGKGGSTTTTRTDYISVSAVVPAKPKAEFMGTPTYGKAPLMVTFTDKSIGKDITAWAWDFNGDGVTDSTEQNPGYTYSTKGNYNVSLTVTNAGGSSTRFKKNYIKVSQLEKPVADFKADKQSGKAPLSVKFMDKSKGDAITEWSWDFNNDGVIDSTEKNPTYTYSTAGRYAVKLVVTNAAGSDMEIKSDFISVKGDQPPAGKKPVAVIFADKTWGTPPMTVKFADQSLNNPTSRTWYFGDGSSSTEANPTHLYADPGIYYARLYVTNDAGSDQDFRFIFVLPKWLSFWATGNR